MTKMQKREGEIAGVTDVSDNALTVNYMVGKYSGEWAKNSPYGKGSFVTDDKKWRYDGKWNSNKLDGLGRLMYMKPNGKVEYAIQGDFITGIPKRGCLKYTSDGRTEDVGDTASKFN